MNTFKMQCVNYLLVNGWEQDVDGWEWWHESSGSGTDYMGRALDIQFELEDQEPNQEPD